MTETETTSLTSLDATGQAELVRNGEASPTELVEAASGPDTDLIFDPMRLTEGIEAPVVEREGRSVRDEILHFRHAVVLFALVWVASELVRTGRDAPATVEPRHAAA